MSRSADGGYLLVPCYNTAAGSFFTGVDPASTATTDGRVVAVRGYNTPANATVLDTRTVLSPSQYAQRLVTATSLGDGGWQASMEVYVGGEASVGASVGGLAYVRRGVPSSFASMNPLHSFRHLVRQGDALYAAVPGYYEAVDGNSYYDARGGIALVGPNAGTGVIAAPNGPAGASLSYLWLSDAFVAGPTQSPTPSASSSPSP